MKVPFAFTKRIGGLTCLVFLSAIPSSCMAQRSAPVRINSSSPALAYVSTLGKENGPSTTIHYDHGRYSVLWHGYFALYDGTDTYVRWLGNTKTRTVQLDSMLPFERLYALVKHDGLERAATVSGIDRSLLARFVRRYPPGLPPRVLVHLLWSVPAGSAEFLRIYRKTGTEKVAGFTCDVYLARNASGDSIWVEPTTHLVLQQHKTYPSGNPRIPPSVWDWKVSRFTPVRSIDPKQFQIPAGYTVILPRIVRDLPLPPDVHRKVLDGKNSFVGSDIRPTVESLEHQQDRVSSHHR